MMIIIVTIIIGIIIIITIIIIIIIIIIVVIIFFIIIVRNFSCFVQENARCFLIASHFCITGNPSDGHNSVINSGQVGYRSGSSRGVQFYAVI